jgi:hypothetical protein
MGEHLGQTGTAIAPHLTITPTCALFSAADVGGPSDAYAQGLASCKGTSDHCFDGYLPHVIITPKHQKFRLRIGPRVHETQPRRSRFKMDRRPTPRRHSGFRLGTLPLGLWSGLDFGAVSSGGPFWFSLARPFRIRAGQSDRQPGRRPPSRRRSRSALRLWSPPSAELQLWTLDVGLGTYLQLSCE